MERSTLRPSRERRRPFMRKRRRESSLRRDCRGSSEPGIVPGAAKLPALIETQKLEYCWFACGSVGAARSVRPLARRTTRTHKANVGERGGDEGGDQPGCCESGSLEGLRFALLSVGDGRSGMPGRSARRVSLREWVGDSICRRTLLAAGSTATVMVASGSWRWTGARKSPIASSASWPTTCGRGPGTRRCCSSK